jgi:hypothetical protein
MRLVKRVLPWAERGGKLFGAPRRDDAGQFPSASQRVASPPRGAKGGLLERFPFEWNRSDDKKSLKIKMLEQALIEKVYQLFRSLL